MNSEALPAPVQADAQQDFFVTQRGGAKIQAPHILPVIQTEALNSGTLQDGSRTLQATLLLQKKKEMQAIQDELERKRQEFSKRMEECREKQEELKSKQRQIRERVAKFEKFLKENDAKRQRANLKAQLERKLREQKEMELQAFSKQLAEEENKAENIKRMLARYYVYEDYLQRVVDVLPVDYLDDVNEPQIKDILMRHKTLVETNGDLFASVQHNADEIEKHQAKLAELIKEKNDQILVFNSKLGSQQKKLDKLKQETAYSEQKVQERVRATKQRMRVLGETKLAIDNIFEKVAVRNPNENPSLTEKLHVIQERLLDLSHIASRAEIFIAQEKAKKGESNNNSDSNYGNQPMQSNGYKDSNNTNSKLGGSESERTRSMSKTALDRR